MGGGAGGGAFRLENHFHTNILDGMLPGQPIRVYLIHNVTKLHVLSQVFKGKHSEVGVGGIITLGCSSLSFYSLPLGGPGSSRDPTQDPEQLLSQGHNSLPQDKMMSPTQKEEIGLF